ncbi:UDP-N-acetylmuramoyl-L-alanine--D-glutamate ligase [Halodesulfovibrio marinisediminis]|uniref:UDP-N-acetylmuramoylalanine--D-glutamate ligase n=1 Tax=Halodesulfovibrio marinisediminis DSM 17456 TaxID=1121457 RepID=A0A1N6HJ58_9BACT|nr:UDP-N-acetylmuramoyl-L-alanine--D-glutamate ligase [Halodesulfovibrio marinisediminis]SIO19773.1 UDP-N-acetylmuramoylalanine--D-glutamate ligase [Halodesulfovibrio marinisediminis DSM 17456]
MEYRPQVVTPGCKAVVVGTGRSGQAAARLLHSLGASVRIVNMNEESVPESFRKIIAECGFETAFGPHTAEQFAGADVVVPSPGVPMLKLASFIPDQAVVLAEVELAWSCIPHIPAIAVTGTNGKTTTVRLCDAMLRKAGKRVFLGGNIGTPLSEFVLEKQEADVLVLEVSSFQLQTCRQFRPTVGVLLNVTEDHLDYHEDMQEYIDAKLKLFANMEQGDMAVLGEEAQQLTASSNSAGLQRAEQHVFSDTGRFTEAPLKGLHNRLNMEAAYAATSRFGVTFENALDAVEDFSTAPHTLETVAQGRGVVFVNDSKATTVDSVRAALESFAEPVLLLAGGHYKGGDLASLNELLKKHVRAVGLYGDSRTVFEAAWNDVVDLEWHESMEDAARSLMSKAHDGDVMLLSPATSSFDQYANYKARGDDFRRIASLLSEQ